MSFSKEKREQIKLYIMDKIYTQEKDIAKRTAEAFSVSLNTVYRYIRELLNENLIVEKGNSFSLVETSKIITLRRTKKELLYEDLIFNQYIKKYIEGFPDNVQRIWEYSFMEMMNNAIDHSNAEIVSVSIYLNYLYTTIIIHDNGIGIFRKIKEYYNYSSLDDAMNELFKGKLTTDSQNHSGEGIFFTSRVLDRFAAVSDGKIFTHDKYYDVIRDLEDVESMKSWKDAPGTAIYMELSNFSKKILREVFDMFSNSDGNFAKTQIPIKNIYETFPVSRSQAKRLCNRFDKFQEVVLDFRDIEEIGQGFAHEIFVVFQKNHPDINITAQNANENVTRMINHVILS